MKSFLSFLLVALFSCAAFANTYNTKIHFVPGGSELVAESGATVTVKSGASLIVDSGATVSISSSVTSNDLALTYGISAATGVFSGAVSMGALTGTSATFSTTLNAAGQTTLGAAATRSTMTAAGALTVHASVSAPALTGTTSITGGAISGTTLDMTGNAHYGATGGAYISTFTASSGAQAWAGSLTSAASITAAAVNISGSGQVLLGNASSTALQTLVPGQAKGALIWNSTTGNLCGSTATVAGSWVLVSTPTVACY